jgi:hypothetical protein
MKFLLVLLAVAVAGFASDAVITGHPGGAGYPLPEFDDVLDSYAYNDTTAFSTSLPASFGDYALIDDFSEVTLDADASIATYSCWGVTTASPATALEILVVADSSGVPTGAPISQTSYTAASGNSGFTFGSYPIYLSIVDLSSSPVAVPYGTTVWIGAIRADGSNWYPSCGTTVRGSEAYRTVAAGWSWEAISGSIEAGDIFRVIEGTPGTSLSRTTWAGIKNMF